MSERAHQELEYKTSFADWRAIVETVAAFASLRGGTIVVGVSDEGEPIGVKMGRRAIEDIVN